MSTLPERLEELEARLDRAEAILRTHRLHEDDCPASPHLIDHRTCTCWLSNP